MQKNFITSLALKVKRWSVNGIPMLYVIFHSQLLLTLTLIFFSNIQIDLYQVTIIVIAMGNNIVFLIFLRTRFLKNILHLSIEQYMKKFVGFIIYMTLIYRLLVT